MYRIDAEKKSRRSLRVLNRDISTGAGRRSAALKLTRLWPATGLLV
jgi:hypothetical protein